MRKFMRAAMAGLTLAAIGIGITGCADESTVKSETQVKTPGGTATKTETSTVSKTGSNPPAVPGDNKAP
jgi:hypothetical protein